jgi:hypothetical protein
MDDMTSALDPHNHGIQRRRIGNILSKSFLHSSRDLPAVMKATMYQAALPLLAGPSTIERHTVDIMVIMRALAMDLWTAFVFGRRVSTRYLEDLPSVDRFNTTMITSRPQQMFYWPSEFPLFTSILEKLGFSLIPDASLQKSDELDAWLL